MENAQIRQVVSWNITFLQRGNHQVINWVVACLKTLMLKLISKHHNWRQVLWKGNQVGVFMSAERHDGRRALSWRDTWLSSLRPEGAAEATVWSEESCVSAWPGWSSSAGVSALELWERQCLLRKPSGWGCVVIAAWLE